MLYGLMLYVCEATYRLLRHDGIYRVVKSKGVPVIDVNGEIREWVGCIIDITERENLEAKLQSELIFNKTLLDNIPAGVVACDEKGILALFNKTSTTWHGVDVMKLPPEEWAKHYDLYCGDGITPLPTAQIPLLRAFNGESFQDAEMSIVVKGKPPRFVLANGTPLYNDKKEKLGAIAIMNDTTEYKKISNKLQSEKVNFQTIMDALEDGVTTIDCNYNILFHNRYLKEKFGTRVKCYQTYEGKEEVCENCPVKMTIADGKPHTSLRRIFALNGEELFFENTATPIKDENGKIIACLELARDITERKRSENKIKTLLEEKEILLKEVHHRTKNHLSLLSSMLFLQIESTKEQAVKDCLTDSQSRIHSICVLYDKLTLTDNFTEISLKAYLDKLVDELLLQIPSKCRVSVEKKLDDIVISSRMSFSLGIIINELITNIIKYAFKNKDKGKVTISTSKQDSKIVVIVQDDGVGMPENLTLNNATSLGLNLVKMMTDGINGTVRIERNNGTRFILEFPI